MEPFHVVEEHELTLAALGECAEEQRAAAPKRTRETASAGGDDSSTREAREFDLGDGVKVTALCAEVRGGWSARVSNGP